MTVHEETVKPQHITLRLDERLVSELRRVAKLNDRSMSSQVRQLLRDGLREYQEERAA